MMVDWAGVRGSVSQLFQWGDLQQALLSGYRLPGTEYTEIELRTVLGQG